MDTQDSHDRSLITTSRVRLRSLNCSARYLVPVWNAVRISSERLFSRGRVDFFSFPLLFLISPPPYLLVFDNKHSPSRDARRNHLCLPITVPLSSFIFLFSIPLVSRPRTTLTDTKLPPCGSRMLLFLSHYGISFMCLHLYAPASPRSPLLYKHRHCQQVACMYISPPSYPTRRASRSWFLSEVSLFLAFSPLSETARWNCRPHGPGRSPALWLFLSRPGLFLSLSRRSSGGTAVHIVSIDLSRSRSSRASAPSLPLSALWRYSELLQR